MPAQKQTALKMRWWQLGGVWRGHTYLL